MRERLGDLFAYLGRRAGQLDHYEEGSRRRRSDRRPADAGRLQRKLATLDWGAGDRPAALAGSGRDSS